MTSGFINNYDFVVLQFILFCYIVMQSILMFNFLSEMLVVLSVLYKIIKKRLCDRQSEMSLN